MSGNRLPRAMGGFACVNPRNSALRGLVAGDCSSIAFDEPIRGPAERPAEESLQGHQ